ncbi:flagellar hook-associated protein 2 [Bacillus sp. JRC01]|nr:flagellar hook-associated protein 2 [Bacillus sp. JRC01]
MRVGGLASGMDTDQIISDLMKAERIPLDKLNQKKQYLEWQRDDYRDMNSLMLNFSNLIFDGVMKQATYIQKTVNVSNPNDISIKNLASTSDFNGTIKVEKLATSATMFGQAVDGSFDPKKKLSDSLGLTGEQTIRVKTINKDGAMPDKFTEVTFDPTVDTMESLLSKINSKTGVTMFFDEKTKQMSVMSKNSGNSGTEAEIQLEGEFFSQMGIDSTNIGATNAGRGSRGENAIFTYNGMQTERSSNTFVINGVEITLKNASNTNVTFSSAPDVDKIMESIVKFVDEYNKLIDKVNGEMNEKKFRDYQPLTAEQKKDMSEDEIKLWEEKARSGTLRNDSVLSSGLNKMRTDLYTSVSGGTKGDNQLSQIGITTSSNYLDRGKLIINESKLKEAISKDPNAIYELFAKNGSTSAEQGIARRMRDTLKSTMQSVEKKAGKTSAVNDTFSIGKLLKNMDSQISRFEDRMKQVESRYWSQFTAMEKAVQRANSQSAYLMQQFS